MDAILLLLFLFVYMVPAMCAQSRHHRNTAAITVLNIFLGWTLIGWVGALVWALTADVDVAAVEQLALDRRSALHIDSGNPDAEAIARVLQRNARFAGEAGPEVIIRTYSQNSSNPEPQKRIDTRIEQEHPFEPDGVYNGVAYKVVEGHKIDAMMGGGLVRFSNMDQFIEVAAPQKMPQSSTPLSRAASTAT